MAQGVYIMMKTHRTGPRTKLIQIRVTPMEWDAIQIMAEIEEMSVSDLVRRELMKLKDDIECKKVLPIIDNDIK